METAQPGDSMHSDVRLQHDDAPDVECMCMNCASTSFVAVGILNVCLTFGPSPYKCPYAVCSRHWIQTARAID